MHSRLVPGQGQRGDGSHRESAPARPVDDNGTHAAHAASERSRDHEQLRTEKAVTETEQKVAIITGGSLGIGAGLVDAYRQRGWAVVANSLSIKPSKDPDIVTVQGDVSEQATADQIMSQALDRFGRVDTLVNNAGVNLAGFFWLTQRAIGQMLKQHGGHVVNLSASIAAHADSVEPTALTALT